MYLFFVMGLICHVDRSASDHQPRSISSACCSAFLSFSLVQTSCYLSHIKATVCGNAKGDTHTGCHLNLAQKMSPRERSSHNLVPLLLCLYFPEVYFQTTIKHCVLLPSLQNYTTQHKITLGVYLSKNWRYFILTFMGTGSQLLAVFFLFLFAVGGNYHTHCVLSFDEADKTD